MGRESVRGGAAEAMLDEQERGFAAENHHIVGEYLRMRRLPEDGWYDVVIFRYLHAVRLWFSRPELHRWKFRTVAYQNMRSAVSNEMAKMGRRIQALSLDAEIPGTGGLAIADFVTYENQDYVNYLLQPGRGEDGMELRYNVKLPPKKAYAHGKKSDERIAVEAFLQSAHRNMCFEYETSQEAKKKLATINAARRDKKETEFYEAYRVDNCVYIVRSEKEKKKAERAVKRGGV